MQAPRPTLRARVPALIVGALIGATALTTITPMLAPAAIAAPAVPQGGYVDFVAKVAPAVVYIEVTKKVRCADDGQGSVGILVGVEFDDL